MTRTAWSLLVIFALAGLAAGAVLLRGEGRAPEIEAPRELALGRGSHAIELALQDAGSGLRRVEVTLAHADGQAELLARDFPGSLLLGGGPAFERVTVTVDPEALGLRDGDAFLRIAVRDWSWRGALAGNRAEAERSITVDLSPPRISVETGLTYVRRGGSGVVLYRVDEATGRDGVQVGDAFFRGVSWPGPRSDCRPLRGPAGGSECRAAIFAVPIDAPPAPPIRVVAEDRSGNRQEARWATRLQERRQAETDIRLSRGFLEGKIAYLARAWNLDDGDLEAAFVQINEARRGEDERRIRELIRASAREPLWQGAFEQMANSRVTSLFAEKRRYVLDGRAVSRATHYGYDLASTAQAPVTASNAGRVLFAGELGIYGDTVLLDHGMGVVTLYGHLSRIEVERGDEVGKGTVLGRSGATGLAGGDHLHFAVLVGDTYVDPLEWWDPKFVSERVTARLRGAARPGSADAEPGPSFGAEVTPSP